MSACLGLSSLTFSSSDDKISTTFTSFLIDVIHVGFGGVLRFEFGSGTVLFPSGSI